MTVFLTCMLFRVFVVTLFTSHVVGFRLSLRDLPVFSNPGSGFFSFLMQYALPDLIKQRGPFLCRHNFVICRLFVSAKKTYLYSLRCLKNIEKLEYHNCIM